MRESAFVFADKCCLDYGIHIEYFPERQAAEKKIETYEIPGRSGRVIFDSGEFENVPQTYETWFKAPPDHNSYSAAREIATWLMGASGYQRLEDTYDPDVYRMAYFSGPVDASTYFARYGRATLEFNCRPQRWLKSGENPVTVLDGDKLYNPGLRALPLIQIRGSGSGTLNINDYTLSISSVPAGGMTIDCETQDAYSGTINRNSLVTVPGKFPALDPGESEISWTGGITGITITPRWWML